MKFKMCHWGVHSYVTKGSWSRCSYCYRKPPTEKRLAPKKDRQGWRKGPIR